MVIKIISLALALCAIELFAIGLQSPADPIYMIISNNPFTVSFRMLFILAAVVLAYKSRFKYKISRQITGWVGSLMIIVGASGMLSQTMSDKFAGSINYLDFWVIFLVGIVFSLSVLSYPAFNSKFYLQKVLARRLPKAWSAKFSQPMSPELPDAKKSQHA